MSVSTQPMRDARFTCSFDQALAPHGFTSPRPATPAACCQGVFLPTTSPPASTPLEDQRFVEDVGCRLLRFFVSADSPRTPHDVQGFPRTPGQLFSRRFRDAGRDQHSRRPTPLLFGERHVHLPAVHSMQAVYDTSSSKGREPESIPDTVALRWKREQASVGFVWLGWNHPD